MHPAVSFSFAIRNNNSSTIDYSYRDTVYPHKSAYCHTKYRYNSFCAGAFHGNFVVCLKKIDQDQDQDLSLPSSAVTRAICEAIRCVSSLVHDYDIILSVRIHTSIPYQVSQSVRIPIYTRYHWSSIKIPGGDH